MAAQSRSPFGHFVSTFPACGDSFWLVIPPSSLIEGGGREQSELIAALTEMRGYLDEDEAELRALTDSALQKLDEITDEDFAALELVPDFDTDE